MRRAWRELRRAPGRIVASVFAIALAVGAVGVLAIPKVSEGTLHAAVGRDGLADLTLFTTSVGPEAAQSVRQLPDVTALAREVDVSATLATGTGATRDVRVVGLELGGPLDRLQLRSGRLPGASGEVVVSPGTATVGDTVRIERDGVGATDLTVVGTGSTLWWSDVDAVFGARDDVIARLAPDGANRLAIMTSPDDEATLRRTADRAREVLRDAGTTMTAFPVELPDGTTPIDEDMRQVSTMIGLLGAVAGLVALVLLGSTTSTLIAERTREVAVMRAMGGRERRLRRRLRRLALGITATALVIGLPLGVLISNLIARMVLEKFVGITPDVAVDWRVVGASAVAALAGARLVSARAARRVTALPLAEALRDREGAPFGRRLGDRALAHVRLGAVRSRIAMRAAAHKRGRAISVVSQIAVGVGATVVITGLATSVNDYNANARRPWSWQAQAVAEDPGLPFPAAIDASAPGAEAGVYVFAQVEGRDIDIYGMRTDTKVFDPRLRSGRWIEPGRHELVISDGFARRRHIEVGDPLVVSLATGPSTYTVVGRSDDANRSLYVDRADLAADLGSPGMANAVWSSSPTIDLELPVAVDARTAQQVTDDDAAGRRAIVSVFGAIGAIVAGVAALAVVSTMAVNLYERRHELATMQALGATRRRVRGVLARELLALGALGVGGGFALGALGTRAVIGAFEASNEVDIPASFARGAVAPIAIGTLLALLALAAHAVRRAGRRPIAVVLRGAA